MSAPNPAANRKMLSPRVAIQVVVARATGDRVGSVAPSDGVVLRPTEDDIVAGGAGDVVDAGTAIDGLDARQCHAGERQRVSSSGASDGDIGERVVGDRFDSLEGISKTDHRVVCHRLDGVVAVSAVDGVEAAGGAGEPDDVSAVTGDDGVVTAAAGDDVGAGQAGQRFGDVTTHCGVVLGRTGPGREYAVADECVSDHLRVVRLSIDCRRAVIIGEGDKDTQQAAGQIVRDQECIRVPVRHVDERVRRPVVGLPLIREHRRREAVGIGDGARRRGERLSLDRRWVADRGNSGRIHVSGPCPTQGHRRRRQ